MKLPLQITTRKVNLSDSVLASIKRKAAKLENFTDSIIGCRVMVETPHRHKNHGQQYNVRIDITMPGIELVVKREPDQDLSVAVRDAFDAARRQILSYQRKRRGEVKHHEEMIPTATVSKIFEQEGYGFLETNDGREIYFHENSVIDKGLDELEIGNTVRFSEKQGVNGPQASYVSSL
ncbi:MAG: HPF/RaiA family ribosome-associated protein [Gammaproteobacteria bacterium]|nr:HPF/RaiA family ribosome-associated protein [Gammaproteobacteria bacterium]